MSIVFYPTSSLVLVQIVQLYSPKVYRVVDAASFTLGKKLSCTCAFLYISKAFDRARHNGLLYKLKKCPPPSYYVLLKPYLTDRNFQIRNGLAHSDIADIRAGVPQRSILSTILYSRPTDYT